VLLDPIRWDPSLLVLTSAKLFSLSETALASGARSSNRTIAPFPIYSNAHAEGSSPVCDFGKTVVTGTLMPHAHACSNRGSDYGGRNVS